jgi:hypothetical protein
MGPALLPLDISACAGSRWPGIRPGGRPSFFAGAKKEGKESTLEYGTRFEPL